MSPRGWIALLLAVSWLALATSTEGANSHATPPATQRAHAAATCSDYPNQQAAQNAADTRDSDGDGIYCEDLPCPCSPQWHAQHDGGGGGGGGSPTPAPTRPHLGPSVTFHRPVHTSVCHTRDHGRLPDPGCTPGAYYKGATRSVICRSGYSRSVRNVSEATKEAVYRAYGITRHSRATYEIDHLVPLEAGGSNVRANLFPEAASPTPGFHQKDRLENWAHDGICAGTLPLRSTQLRVAHNWVTVYRAAF
jgi:hypothetical protein